MRRVVALAVIAEHAPIDEQRPVTRGDCVNGPRPCVRVRCPHHIETADVYGDRIAIAGHTLRADATEEQIDAAVDALVELLRTRPSCALDLIDKHTSMTLQEIGVALGITRERIRQIEAKGLRKLPRQIARARFGVDRDDFRDVRRTPHTRDD